MDLAGLLDLLAELPTLPDVDLVAHEAGVGVARVEALYREGVRLGLLDVRRTHRGPLASYSPYGAARQGVALVEVRYPDPDLEDGWREEPRWLPLALAHAILEGIRHQGYPVDEDDGSWPGDCSDRADPSQAEPLEYLIAEEEAEKRLAADGKVLPYPSHLYGAGAPWREATPGETAAHPDCPHCRWALRDPRGYCLVHDAYGLQARLPAVVRRPRQSRLQLGARCSLAGGRGKSSKLVERYEAKQARKARKLG